MIENTEFSSSISRSEDPEEILSQITNEFKHPITAIKGYADLILRGEIGSREAAERIYDIAEKMEMLQNIVFNYLRARGAQE
jgi:signal transduction histidine kinase